MPENKKYHYTCGARLGNIIYDGEIMLTDFWRPGKKRELAVWVSTNKFWEETANKLVVDKYGNILNRSREVTHQYAGGLARIEVRPESAPFNWKHYVKKSKIPHLVRRAFEMSGAHVGANPSQWYASFKPIKKEDWLNIEVFDWEVHEWKPYSPAATMEIEMKAEGEKDARLEKKAKKLGDCYEAHFRSILDSQIYGMPYEFYGIEKEKVFLCHGTVHCPDFETPRHGHAWLEYGDSVIDLTNGEGIGVDRDFYYELGVVKDVVRYNLKEVCKMVMKYEHMGPWND